MFKSALVVWTLFHVFIGCAGQAPDCISASCTCVPATSDDVSIFSPNYPFSYGNYANQCWLVYADDADNFVQVTIDELDTETSSTACTYDKLEVYDGDSVDANSECWSGNLVDYSTSAREFVTTGPYALISFTSDGSISSGSWKLSVKATGSSGGSSSSSGGLETWEIVAITVGCLFAVGILVFLCCVCSQPSNKKKTSPAPGQPTTGQATTRQPASYGQQAGQPPPYGQQTGQGGMVVFSTNPPPHNSQAPMPQQQPYPPPPSYQQSAVYPPPPPGGYPPAPGAPRAPGAPPGGTQYNQWAPPAPAMPTAPPDASLYADK